MAKGKPKFDTKSERIRFAIRKKYLSEEDWTNPEIAEELNVSPAVVSKYINHTPQAEEVQRAKSEIETEQWRQLLSDLMQRIDRLSELERQLWDVVEPVVSGYEFEDVEAEVETYHLQQGGDSMQLDLAPEEDDTGEEVNVEIPVPAQWKEIPEFSRLRSVWSERRKAEEQLANLLGLEADENVNVSGEITERKVYAVETDDYPDAAPHEMGDEPSQTDDAPEDQEDD